jgi:hypothetical protein
MATVHDVETFWAGVWLYQFAAPIICDAGGSHYSYVRKQSPTSYSFDVRWYLPLLSPAQIRNLLSPLYNKLTSLGIPVQLTIPPAVLPDPNARTNTGIGAAPANSYFASRLFPRANWDNATIYNTTFTAIRASTEAGFVFHGVNFWTPLSVAGYPGNGNAIADHWRGAIMHADVFADALDLTQTTADEFRERHARLEAVMDGIREATRREGRMSMRRMCWSRSGRRRFLGISIRGWCGSRGSGIRGGCFGRLNCRGVRGGRSRLRMGCQRRMEGCAGRGGGEGGEGDGFWMAWTEAKDDKFSEYARNQWKLDKRTSSNRRQQYWH